MKLPNITVSGYSSLGGVNSAGTMSPPTFTRLRSTSRTIVGAHTLRYGFAYRVYRRNNFNLGNSVGQSSTSIPPGRAALSTTRPRRRWDRASPRSSTGSRAAAASPINDSYADQSTVPALFVQDDWKLSRKLTSEPRPALRAAHRRSPSATTAASGASTPNVASPIQAQALANYARSPIPEAAGQPVQGSRRPDLRGRQRPAARTLEDPTRT